MKMVNSMVMILSVFICSNIMGMEEKNEADQVSITLIKIESNKESLKSTKKIIFTFTGSSFDNIQYNSKDMDKIPFQLEYGRKNVVFASLKGLIAGALFGCGFYFGLCSKYARYKRVFENLILMTGVPALIGCLMGGYYSTSLPKKSFDRFTSNDAWEKAKDSTLIQDKLGNQYTLAFNVKKQQ